MNEVVVLTYLDKIYERKFKIKILVKFMKNYMCSIEMKPLWIVLQMMKIVQKKLKCASRFF